MGKTYRRNSSTNVRKLRKESKGRRAKRRDTRR